MTDRGIPLHIALVVERFAPGTGGVENVAWQVAHELVRQGEDVTVVARAADPAPGIRVQLVSKPGRRNPLRALAFSRAAARATGARTSGARPFDVVHSFSRTRHQDLFRAGGGSHADYLRRTHSRAGVALRRLLPRHQSLLALERQVFADPAQGIQCSSRLVADGLVAAYGVDRDRILLLPNAVDGERFDANRHAAAGRALRLRLDEKAERIWLFPGSGWHRKGLDLGLAALARVDDPGLRLWVAGRDDPAPWLRRAARAGLSERVRFLGPRSDLEVVYAAVDGMLLPTRYDAFANVTFEAAASGLAILTTATNGAAEWLPAEACLTLRADRAPAVDALARALGDLSDTHVRRAMGEAARRAVLAHHWPGHVASLRAQYARIAARRREPR